MIDGYQRITPKPVTVTIVGHNDTFNYDGNEHTVTGYDVSTEDTLYDISSVKPVDASATRTDSGTSYMGLTADRFENTDANFNVTFDVTDGFIVITGTKITVRIAGETNTSDYDGTEHIITGYNASSESDLFNADNVVFTGTDEASRTDAGTTMMGLSVEDFSYNDRNVEAEFIVEDGYQTITPITAEVTITGNSDTSNYDGQEHVITGYTAVADTPLFDTDSDIEFTGTASASRTDVGISYMGLMDSQFENKNPNFENVRFTIEEDGKQTIVAIPVYLTVVGNHETVSYDGESHTVTGYTITADSDLYDTSQNIEFSGSAEAIRTNAGITNMRLATSQFENINSNFTVGSIEIEDGYIQVDPIGATVTITGHDGRFMYDGTEHVVTGYEAEFSTDLYDDTCFTLVSSGSDRAPRTNAGITYMNLLPESFRNISENFNDVTFVVTDGFITIDPAVTVSKYLRDELATDAQDFTFNLQLTDADEDVISDFEIMDGVSTDEEGMASFTLSVVGMETESTIFEIPYASNLWIEEDKTDDPNNYSTSINGAPGAETELGSVSDNQVTLAFENTKGAICRIGDVEFQTISSAVQWAQDNFEEDVTIEMLVDYTMSATDQVSIPFGQSVTLITAPDYPNEGSAVITRSSDFTGIMLSNLGTLNIGDGNAGSAIIFNGASVEANAPVISNSGNLTLNEGSAIQNAVSTVNGAALNNTGTVTVNGGSFTNNRAVNGGAVYTAGKITIYDGTIENNSAETGGAIYATSGEVTFESGSLSNNAAEENGGAVFSESGIVDINGGIVSGNAASNGNGGAVYTNTGTAFVTGGSVIKNTAVNGNGGAFYTENGGVNVSGGTIGGSAEDANQAITGSAVYVNAGSANFSGNEESPSAISYNIASNGGAVDVGSESVRLFFSGSTVISNNTNTEVAGISNVYLNFDTDLIINAIGLNSNSEIGIYVPGDDELYEHRGISGARFGGYTNNANIGCFKNDRTPGMTVSEDNFKMQWGKAITVEIRELASFSGTSLPPAAAGTLKQTLAYFPDANENYMSDMAGKIMDKVTTITSGYAFAAAFVRGASAFDQCITKVDWSNESGDWAFMEKNGQYVTYGGDNPTLLVYYSAPAYVAIANNTVYHLDLTSLVANGIHSEQNGFGFVIAKSGTTVEHFTPVSADDLSLDPGVSIKVMFPGVRKQTVTLTGQFSGGNITDDIPVTYVFANGPNYTTGEEKKSTVSPADATAGFSLNSLALHLFNNADTVNISFGTATMICKIVEMNSDGTVKEEHLYPSIQAAVTDGDTHYDDYKITVTDPDDSSVEYETVKVEMIQDYLIPSTDAPDVPSGRNFTFTTAIEGVTEGERVYSGETERAVISQDQGKTNSFIKSSVGGPGTAIIIDSIDFEGKQLDARNTNGGVINTKDCSLTIRNANFSDFSAGNGGAVYAQFGGDSKANNSEYSGDNNFVKVTDSDFINCASKAAQDRFGGGAIWTNAEVLELSDCDFERCNATQQGGAVYHRIDDTYSYKTTSKTIINNSTFKHCSANAAGGLEINAFDIEINDCVFEDCQALTRNGGGFNAYLRSAKETGTILIIRRTTFNDCFAMQDGGVFRTMMNTTVINSTFTNNTANGNGGGIAQNNSNALILDHCTITGNKSGLKGGGIYTNGNVTLMNNTSITGNSLTSNTVEDGAGLFISGARTITLGPADSQAVDTCEINNNVTADGSQSNLWLPEKNGGLENDNKVIVRSNFTTGPQGNKQIHVINAKVAGTEFGSTSDISSPTGFSNGEHIFVSDYNDLYGITNRSSGTRIFWNTAPICKITDDNGKLLYFDNEGKDPAVFERLDNGNNTAADEDGAFSYLKNSKNNIKLYRKKADGTYERYTGNSFCVKMLTDNYFLGKFIATNTNNSSWQTITFTTAGKNSILEDGFPFRGNGDVAVITRTTSVGVKNPMIKSNVNLRIENIVLDGNGNVAPGSDYGPIIYEDKVGTTLTLGEGTILRNGKTTGERAGAVYIKTGDISIEGALITNCTAKLGGAIYKREKGTVNMSSGRIENCYATQDAGAIYLSNGVFTMTGGTIENCTADRRGGAIYFSNYNNPIPDLRMSGGKIINNHAGAAGGGMTFDGANGRVYFSGNAIVYGNTLGNDNVQCNVELNQDNLNIINSSGLTEEANIGIYTTGTNYDKHGVQGKEFGSWSSDTHLEMFVNDRNEDLHGAISLIGTKKIWWQKMQSLTVTKTVSSDLSADMNHTFNFTVTLSTPGINGTFGSLTFVDSVATFSLKHGEMIKAVSIPTDNVVGEFTVAETEDPGFDTKVNDEEGTTYYSGTFYSTQDIEDDTEGLLDIAHYADFENTRKFGNLVITKVVESDQAADNDREFNFRVVLSAKEVHGVYGDVTFNNGVAVFKLKSGEHVTAENLPSGIQYTVTENADNDFITTTEVNEESVRPEDITLQSGDNNHVVFTNTKKVGGLRLIKTVTSDATADHSREYEIAVTLRQNGEPVNATYSAIDNEGTEIEGGVEFNNGVHVFSVRPDESITILGIQQGVTYEVEEITQGFTTRYTYVDSQGRPDSSRTIGSDIITCTVANTRNSGKLQISKVIESDKSSDASSAVFTFIVSLGNRDEENNFIVDTNINKTYGTVRFTNGVSDPITVTGQSNKVLNGIPQGLDYEVVEQDRNNFRLKSSLGTTGTIGASTKIAYFVNERITGNLKISKTVRSDASSDHEKSFSFMVKLGDTKISKTYMLLDESGEEVGSGINFIGGTGYLSAKDGESRTIVGLPTEVTYAVTETAASGFTTESTNASGTIGDTIVIDEETHEEIYLSETSFINTRNVGNLIVRKKVVSDLIAGLYNDANKDFTFKVRLGRLDGSGNFIQDETIDNKTYGPVTFNDGETTFHLKHNEEMTIEGLPGDIRYVVEETEDADFTTTSTGAAGTISSSKNSEAVFTNTRKTGNLNISKTVISDVSSDRSVQYSFTVQLGKTVNGVFTTDTSINKRYENVTFTNGTGTLTLRPSAGSANTTITGIPHGVEYQVSEAPVENMVTTNTGESGTISSTSISRAAFTNTRETGTLKISKILTSDLSADKENSFEFTVKIGSINNTYTAVNGAGEPVTGGVSFENGTALVHLKGGESISIQGLPSGLNYTITEDPGAEFTVVKENDRGMIDISNVAESTFENIRKTGDIRVTKRVTSDLARDTDRGFKFTITLSDTGIGKTTEEDPDGKTYGGVTFKNGVAEFVLKKDQSVTAEDLPVSVEYTVTEEAVSGFTLETQNDTGTVTTERSNVVFTNIRETGDLKVSKVLNSDLAVDLNREFKFKVTLSDTSIGAVTEETPQGKTFGGMNFKNGVSNFTLKGGQSITAIGLPAGIEYVVEEIFDEPNTDFDVTSVGETGAINKDNIKEAIFTNSRKTGTLNVLKTLNSELTADKDVLFRFTVALTGLKDSARNKTYGDVQFRNGSATVQMKGGETKVITGLPKGVAYTVKENLTTAQTSDFTVSPVSGVISGTIGDTTETDPETEKEIYVSTADFTNTRKVGNLTISKTLVSDLRSDWSVEFPFVITLDDISIGKITEDSPDGRTFTLLDENNEEIEGGITFRDGIAELTMKGGEGRTIVGLPTDVRATVRENLSNEQKADYTTNPSNLTRVAVVTVSGATAPFSNTRKQEDCL